MKSVIFDQEWEERLRTNKKSVFISKGSKYSHLLEISIYIKYKQKKRLLGYSKIYRIVEVTGRDINNVSLTVITQFRIWLTIAHRYGCKTVQELLGELDGLKFKDNDMLQILYFYPILNIPYNKKSLPKEVNYAA